MADFMDDATRTYTVFDADQNVVSQRSYTAEENAQLDERIAGQVPNQQEADRARLRLIIQDLKAEKDRAQAVIDDPTSSKQEKDLGRSCRRIADAAIDLAKFVRD